MNERNYEKELIALRKQVIDLNVQLQQRDIDIMQYRSRIRELEAKIARVESKCKFFIDQNNINLADNRRLWDLLRRNPYSDDFYNES